MYEIDDGSRLVYGVKRNDHVRYIAETNYYVVPLADAAFAQSAGKSVYFRRDATEIEPPAVKSHRLVGARQMRRPLLEIFVYRSVDGWHYALTSALFGTKNLLNTNLSKVLPYMTNMTTVCTATAMKAAAATSDR